MTVKKVLVEAMKLKPNDRLNVARELIESVDEADEPEAVLPPNVEREIDRRLKELDEHPEIAIPFEVAEKQLDALMRRDARKRK